VVAVHTALSGLWSLPAIILEMLELFCWRVLFGHQQTTVEMITGQSKACSSLRLSSDVLQCNVKLIDLL
jgi:hypothetical protein